MIFKNYDLPRWPKKIRCDWMTLITKDDWNVLACFNMFKLGQSLWLWWLSIILFTFLFFAFYELYIGASRTVRIKEGRDADSYYKDGNDDQQRVVQRFLPPWGRHGEPLLLLATMLEVATMHTEHHAHYAHRTGLCTMHYLQSLR